MPDRRLENLFDRFRERGDVAALARVFDETAPELLRVARHLARDHAAAEDLVQGTFVAAMEKRASFDSRRELLPWLVGILLKQASLARRALARVIEPERIDPPASEDPLEAAAARELSDALATALAKLDPIDRAVLIPLLLDGRRAVEIARELGRRPDTIHMRIHRSLGRLRRLLPASFALGALVRSGHARGLSAVRTEVLRHARIELGLAGAGGTVMTLVTVGTIMTTKKLGLVLAAIVLCLAIGGYFAATPSRSPEVVSSAPVGPKIEQREADGSRKAAEVASARAEAAIAASHDSVASTREPGTLEIEVVREDREPVRDAQVVLVDAAGVLSSAKTDVHGRCSFPASALRADVYVGEDAALPCHAAIEVAEGHRTIEIPQGKVLSGRLELTSGEPLPPIEVRLSTDIAPAGLAEASLEVFRALGLVEYDSRNLFARTHSGPDGGFRFHGLMQGWSGALQLPTELVFVVDSKATGSNQRVFLQGASDLLLPVAYRPRILGRLVDTATHFPLESESMCAITWSNGDSLLTAVRTGVDGRFVIALDGKTDAKAISFERVAGSRITPVTAPVSWKADPTLCDVGDIECAFPASRSLTFNAIAADHQPLVGVRAQIGQLEIVKANASGVGVFPAVPLEEKEMLIAAAGYAITAVALTPDIASPITVELVPTNRLTIALPPGIAGRHDLSLALVSKVPLFHSDNRMYDALRREGMSGRCFSASGFADRSEGYVNFAFSPDGIVELEGIRSDTPFRARLLGSRFSVASTEGELLAEVAVDSIGAQEQRRIDLAIDPARARSLRVLEIHAINEQSLPVYQAAISLDGDDDTNVGRTDLDGRFQLDLTSVESVNIEVRKRGFVPFRVRGLDLSTTAVLEARLVRGRDLRVEVVDESGRPVAGTRVSAEIAGFGRPWRTEGKSAGVVTLCDLPRDTSEITVEVGGRRYVRSIDTGAEVLRFVLPVHGSLEVRWAPITEFTDGKRRDHYRLALRPTAADGAAVFHEFDSLDDARTHAFAALFPGQYSIAIESASDSMTSDELAYEATRAPIEVTVVAGETRRIELGP